MTLINPYIFGAAAWSPADLPNLAGWWDASVAGDFTFSSGTVVSQWNDRSGNARHFTQSTVANQPSRSGTQNSLSTVVFDGTNDQLDTGSFTVAQPLTLLVAGDLANPGAARSLVSGVGGNLQVGYWGPGGLGTAMRMYAGTAEIDVLSTATASEIVGVHAFSYVVNGASSASWIDGVAKGTGNPGSSGTTTGLRIAERNLANMFQGEMFEIIVCSSALSTTDRQTAEDYLSTKWATP